MTQTPRVQLPIPVDKSEADAVHPSGSRSPRTTTDAEEIYEREDGCIHRPPSFTLLALAGRSALASYRRSDDVALDGPPPAPCRQTQRRRHPPKRLPSSSRRRRRRRDLRTRGWLHPPSPVFHPVRLSLLPSRACRSPRRSISRSVHTDPKPTQSTQAAPVVPAPPPMPKISKNAKKAGLGRPS